jgi:hypothetical protein
MRLYKTDLVLNFDTYEGGEVQLVKSLQRRAPGSVLFKGTHEQYVIVELVWKKFKSKFWWMEPDFSLGSTMLIFNTIDLQEEVRNQ